MPAVGEPAPSGQGKDIRECSGNAPGCCTDTDFAEPGIINHERPSLQDKELPDSRRMPAFPVIIPGTGCVLHGIFEQPVDEGRLADSGRTYKDDRCARSEIRVELPDPIAAFRAQGDDRNPGRDREDLVTQPVRVIGEIGLVDQDYRSCPGSVDNREVPFDTADIQVMAGCRDDKHDVSVRCDDLVGSFTSGSAPGKPCLPGKDVHNHHDVGARQAMQHDKIAYGRITAEFFQRTGNSRCNGPFFSQYVPDRLLPAGNTAGQAGPGVF